MRLAAEEALLEAAFEGQAPEQATPAGEPADRRGGGRTRRAKLLKEAAAKVRARPQEAVSLLDLAARALPARLGKLAGREGWWFAYRFGIDSLVSEERVIHLVLWFDGERFHALDVDKADAFAATPARESKGGPRSATVSIGTIQEEALAALHARMLATVQERSGQVFDEARERWDRSVEDALAAARKAAEDARQAWLKSRASVHEPRSDLAPRERRALMERAEREFRRKLDDLRATEALRYGERDRAVAELRRRAEVKERRTLVGTAYWKCG